MYFAVRKQLDMKNELLAITYSEFDNIAGPTMRHCFPPDTITKEAFEPISDYVILGKHLCNKLITVKQDKWQLMSYPIAIENDKYERNTLSFSFSFVLSVNCRINEYGKVLKSLATYFQEIEVCPFCTANAPFLTRSLYFRLKEPFSSTQPQT